MESLPETKASQMGTVGQKSPRYRICNAVFILKALTAIILGSFALGLNGYKVFDLYNQQQDIINQRLKPIVIDPSKCLAPTGGLARLEPPVDTVMLGFHLDWVTQLPISMKPILGFNPATINAFLTLDPSKSPPLNTSLFEWHAQEVQRIGGVLSITLQPMSLPDTTDEMLQLVADFCYKVNTKYGVPLFMRYGHEMNGDWLSYGMQPTLYKSSFVKLATAIRKSTNMTAMVFGPNNGINYPFTSPDALVKAPLPGSADFLQLDTNGDGVLNNSDDPYLPYYPGDDYVDWVALSQYWYPDANTGYNILPPATYFVDSITSTGPSMALQNEPRNGDPTRNFYNVFVNQRKKPMMIPETSAPFIPSEKGPATDPEIKQAWWNELLGSDTRSRFPRLKLITQFEENKADATAAVRDWRVTLDQAVLRVFLGVLNQFRGELSYASDFQVDCGGNWKKK